MYSTSSEHTRVPWAAHSYNVAFSDEIGHFEYCIGRLRRGRRLPRPTTRARSTTTTRAASAPPSRCSCRSEAVSPPTTTSTAPRTSRSGRDGSEPRAGRQSTTRPRSRSRARSSTATQNYSRVAFEADLPRIEAADFGGICNRFTGANCVNPPPGSNFYPIYTTGRSTQNPSANGHCVWQFGGPYIKGTTNTFGGNSAAEFGPLLFSFYPNPEPSGSAADEQLPQRTELESLSGLRGKASAESEARPRGALRVSGCRCRR